MVTALVLLVIQGLLGASDTLYYHELRLRLAARPSARRELQLHASRDFAYAILFGLLGWFAWHGALAWALLGLLAVEIAITLADFVEEDRTRKLPAGERVMHAIMGIVYGAFLACALPTVLAWSRRPTGLQAAGNGGLSWAMSLMAVGVLLSGIRDLVSAQTGREWPQVAWPRPGEGTRQQ